MTFAQDLIYDEYLEQGQVNSQTNQLVEKLKLDLRLFLDNQSKLIGKKRQPEANLEQTKDENEINLEF